MERVDWTNAERADRVDWSRMSKFAQEAVDRIAEGALGYPAHWARFLVAEQAGFTITVSPGEHYNRDLIYVLLSQAERDLTPYRPLVAGTTKWVAILVGGQEVTVEENRAIQTENVEGGGTVQRQVPKIIRRAVTIAELPSDITGAKPAIPVGSCCIAMVLLTTTGIDTIEPYGEHRVVPLYEVEQRLKLVEERVDRLRRDTDSIATDVSALATQLDALPPPGLFQQFGRDIARNARALGQNPLAGNYFFDPGLVDDFWDLTHPDSYLRLDHGLRFPFAAVSDTQLMLADPSDPQITVTASGTLMPSYQEVVRIETPVGSGRQRVANVVTQETIATEHQQSHSSTTYGPTERYCENDVHWNEADLRDREYGERFAVAGVEYQALGVSDIPWNATETAQNGHLNFDVQQVFTTSWTSSYTTYHTVEYGLNNAAFAQTFRTSQIFVATGVELYMTKVDPTQQVTITMGRTHPNGAPAMEAMLGRGSVEGADLSVGWQKVPVKETLISQELMAWTLATPGNNEIAKSDNNAFSNGSAFTITDGAFAQGSALEDYSFRILGARFDRTRTFVDFGPYDLQGGIGGIEVLIQGLMPPGTERVWAFKPNGATEWTPFDNRTEHLLTNLPASGRLGCWFVGTRDLQPTILMSQLSRVRLFRLANTMSAVSKVLDFGFATDTLSAGGHVDNYDPARGVPEISIYDGSTEIEASTLTVTPDPSRPGRSRVEATWALPEEISACRVRFSGTKQSALDGWFWQDAWLNAF
jgi:hypothetical protein